MARRRDKGQERRIAAARVDHLLDLARAEALGPDADLADRYARLAMRVAERYRTRPDPAQKAQVCRACGCYRVAGRTLRQRLSRGRIVTTCLNCGDVRRRPLAERAPATRRPRRSRPASPAPTAAADAGAPPAQEHP